MAFPSSLTICDLYTCKADEITARVKAEMQELEHPGLPAPEPGTRLVHNGENYAVTSISPDGVVIMREDEEGNYSLPEVISTDTYYAEKQAEIDAQEQEQQPQSGEGGEAAQEIASPAEEEPAPVTGGGAVQEETAVGRMPKDEQGQPLYEQADAETAWDALLEQAGGDEAMAQEVANDIVSEQEKALKTAERELKKVQDGKPQQRKGDAPLTVEARIAAKQAVREQTSRAQAGVDEARKRLEAWRKIAETPQRRRRAIEAERRQEEEEAARLRGIQEEQGQPIYEQADPDTAWDALLEQAGGDEAMAQEVANDIVSEQEKALKTAERELKKVQDGKPQQRKGDAPLTVEARIAAKQAVREQTSRAQAGVDEARKRLEAWRKIAETPQRRRQAIEAERRQEEEESQEAMQKLKDEVVDNQGNPIGENGRLIVEKVNSIEELTDEDFTNPTRSVELPQLPEAVSDAIGANGKPVVIKKNIFEKNKKTHRDLSAQDSRGIIKAALYSPQLYGQNKKTSRPFNWILIHLADKHSSIVIEVNNNKDNYEIVGWHYLDEEALQQKRNQAVREGGLILTIPQIGSAAGNAPENSKASGSKGSEKSEAVQENSQLSQIEQDASDFPFTYMGQQYVVRPIKTDDKGRYTDWFNGKTVRVDNAPEEATMAVFSPNGMVFEGYAARDNASGEYKLWYKDGKLLDKVPGTEAEREQTSRAQAGVDDGSKPADTHSDNQRSGNKDSKTAAETSQERQKTDSNLSEAFKQQMNIRIGQLSKFIKTKDGKLKKKYESLRKTPFFAIFDSGNIYEGPVAIAKTPREALNVAFNYDIGDFEVLYVDFRTKSLDMDLLSIYDVSGFRGDVYDENGAYKDEAKNLLVERISRLGKGNSTDVQGVEDFQQRESGADALQGNADENIRRAESEVERNPTEAQKEAGNYRKGHVRVDGLDVTIENPKGSVRSGTDADGKRWENVMNNTYGYMRGTEGVDGDHIDVFLSDNPESGNVYVVDQRDPKTGEFDEHKVMYGFGSMEEARDAYLKNYTPGWQGLGTITEVSKDEFRKWIGSSKRKTKPFAEYKSVKKEAGQNESNVPEVGFEITPAQYTTKRGKVLDMFLVKFAESLTKEQQRAAKELARAERGWYDRNKDGFMMRSEESAQKLANTVMGDEETVNDAQPLSLADMQQGSEPAMRQVDVEGLMQAINRDGEAKLSDHFVIGRPGLTEEMRTGQEEETPQSKKNDDGYGADNKLVSRERYEELKKRMRRKLGGQMNMGIDPEILAIGTKMAAYHIEAGARKFADYARHMIDDLGDAIRPYLKSFYNGARDLPEVQEAGYAEGMTPYDEVRTFDTANFDKSQGDAMATAEMVVAEQEAQAGADTAKEQLINQRNKQRRQEEPDVKRTNNENGKRNKDTGTDNSGTQLRPEELPASQSMGAGTPVQDAARDSQDQRLRTRIGSSESGIRPQYDVNKNYSNEEITEIVSSVTDVVDGKVVLTGEATNDIKSIVRQYKSGGVAKQGRGILDEYYTDGKIVDAVNLLISPYFKDGKSARVLEPSVGIGNFIEALRGIKASEIEAFEINETTARITKVLYPQVDVNVRSFETEFIDEEGNKKPLPKKYGLVIGNPPYGSHRGLYKGLGEESKIARYEDYFVKRSLDVLEEGGVLAMVLPSSWIDRHTDYGGYKVEAAYRLPSGAFEATQVGTDIVVLRKDSSVPRAEHAPYFEQHPERVLGVVKQRKGRYGRLEDYVEGDIDAAIEAIEREQAAGLTQRLGMDETGDNVDAVQSAIEETGSADKAAPIVKAAQTTTETSKATKPAPAKAITGKYKLTLNRGAEVVPASRQFTHPFSEEEVEAFADTDYDGTLHSPEEHRPYANYIGGKYVHDFYYAEGDIYEKLAQLERDKRRITDLFGQTQYDKQKRLLESVLPKRKGLDDITISPNTAFVKNLQINTGDEAKSLKDLFIDFCRKLPYQAFGDSSPWEVIGYVNNEQVYGQDKRRNQLVRERRKRAANDLFAKFLHEELPAEAQAQVVAAFNREYNSTYRPDYSKVPIFSSINKDFKGKDLKLTNVQLAGIGRMTVKGVGVLAHEVGFGKTLSGVLAMHEAMTRGFARKPLIVVPNDNILQQWVETINEALPNATVNTLGNLGASYDLSDFKVNDGEFTIITYEGLKAMSFHDDTYDRLGARFSYITEDLKSHKTERDKQQAIEKRKELKGKMKRGTKKSYNFEDFGFDWLTFDEVHNANHIVSKVRLDKSVASDFRSQSQRTSDLGMKTWLAAQYIQEQNNGRNVLLLSATPFTNKPLEYYSILSLVGNDMLKRKGFFNVDQFFETFMEADNELEIAANGRPVQKTNIRRFRNNGLFQQLLSEFIDIKGEEDNPDLVRPERRNKEYKIAQNELTAEAMEAVQDLLGDNETVLQGIGHARAAAFSPYATPLLGLRPKGYKEFVENSPKIDAAIQLIEQNKKDRPDAGQIIYSEVGVEFFPMIRDYLVKESGFKPEEVRIITGATSNAERVNIQTAFNEGKVKVVIGSPAIKEGLNLQGNTTDMYILSLPWNFTQLRQIEGRGWRQGNKWENIRINYLLTNDSIDVFMLQRLQLKQRLYNEAMKSGAESLDVSDIDTSELKTALITDPNVRAEIETVQERGRLQQEKTRIEADLSFMTRKYEAYNKVLKELNSQKLLVNTYRQYAKNDRAGDSYWENLAKEAENKLPLIEKKIEQEKQNLLKKGIDVADMERRTEQSQQASEAIQRKIDDLENFQRNLAARYRREAEAKSKEQGDVLSTYLDERREENNGGFYKIRPKEKAFLSPSQVGGVATDNEGDVLYRLDDYTTNEEEANDLFRVVDDASEIERLNNEPTIKVYRAMSLEDENLFRIGETKRIGRQGKKITFTRANPTVTLNALKKRLENEGVEYKVHKARTGSGYISFEREGIYYDLRSANHTTAYTSYNASDDTGGVELSFTREDGRIDGIDIDLSENEMGVNEIYSLMDEAARFNANDTGMFAVTERLVYPEEINGYEHIAAALGKKADDLIREREMALRAEYARYKDTALQGYERPNLLPFKAGNGAVVEDESVRKVYFNGKPAFKRYATEALSEYFRERNKAMRDFEAVHAMSYDEWLASAHPEIRQEEDNMRDGTGAVTDDEVSMENDPMSKLAGKSIRTRKQRQAFAERERRRMAGAVREMAERLHLDNVEVVTDASTLTGRRARAKGFYSPRTGKIVIVIPNHASEADAMQTLLHEAVAHYGLRQLFGEHFDTFLWNVYRNADRDVRERINALASEKGWDFPTATEEYLASLAENTDFENAQRSGWWEKIKRLFIDMLHKIGLDGFSGVTLSDNELRYILWRSYENLREPGAERSITGVAADVVKQAELKVGNYAEETTGGNMAAERKSAMTEKQRRIEKLRRSEPVVATGEEYKGKYELNNKSAADYIIKSLKGEYVNKDTGVPIKITRKGAFKITRHDAENEAHLKSIALIPRLIENAVFVEEEPNSKANNGFDSYRYYVAGLNMAGADYTVKMAVGVKNGETYYDHSLTEIEKSNLINRIDEISSSFTDNKIAISDLKDKRLVSILQTDEEENEDELMYRDGGAEEDGTRDTPLSSPTVHAWDRLAQSLKFQLRETTVDYLTAIDKFQDLIAKHSGRKIESFENAYDWMTFLTSRNRVEMDMFDSSVVRPLNNAILKLTGNGGTKQPIIFPCVF